MRGSSQSFPWIVVVLSFVIGYILVSAFFQPKKRFGTDQPSKPRRDQHEGGPESSGEAKAGDPEDHYRFVIGVPRDAGEDEVRSAYRTQLNRYHPERVTHLGTEFHDLASRRTRELIEAYEFLKKKYGYR